MDRFHSVAVRSSLVSEDKYNNIKRFCGLEEAGDGSSVKEAG
jgi:hypothetical protein